MDLIARRFRGVLIAIVVLGLSATAVFAGHVAFQAPATSPTAVEQGDQEEQADENDNETPDADEDADANEAPDADEDSDEDSDGAADNHGALVSTAARMDTPVGLGANGEGFKNHGQFVSCVAHMKTAPVLEPGQTLDKFLMDLTPDDCTPTDETAALSPDERDEVETDAEGNHGALVSEAARMPTPVMEGEGAVQFKNHGEFVSCVARTKSLPTGFTGNNTDFLKTVTPESCGLTATADDGKVKADKVHGKSGQHGKGRGHKRS